MGDVAKMLHEQIEKVLDTAAVTDSLMAEQLFNRKRSEVEDKEARLDDEKNGGVILKGVLLTDAPQTIDPISLALRSLKNKIDEAKDAIPDKDNVSAKRKSGDIAFGEAAVDAVDDGPIRKHRAYLRDTAINEYRDNPELIGGAFPDLLPLGFTKADIGGKGGTLPTKMVQAWFLSRDRRFAEHRTFNHFMFNQKIRHDTNLKVSVKVQGNDAMTQELTRLVNQEDFEVKLLTAIRNPTSVDAKEISGKVLPLLKIVGSRVGWPSFERSNKLTRLYAMNQFFGTSFICHTVTIHAQFTCCN